MANLKQNLVKQNKREAKFSLVIAPHLLLFILYITLSANICSQIKNLLQFRA